MRTKLFIAITVFQIVCLICIVLGDSPKVDIPVLIVQYVALALYILKIRKLNEEKRTFNSKNK